MSEETVKLFHVPHIDRLGARCALVLVAGSTGKHAARLEAVTLAAKLDGSTHAHIEETRLAGPPFKESAEQAIHKAQAKALVLLATDGSLSNKLTELGDAWLETTESATLTELQTVRDELAGLLERVHSEALKAILRQALASPA